MFVPVATAVKPCVVDVYWSGTAVAHAANKMGANSIGFFIKGHVMSDLLQSIARRLIHAKVLDPLRFDFHSLEQRIGCEVAV
jgi:hypothetical protein